jgi:thioredoxin reductase (NADPH)
VCSGRELTQRLLQQIAPFGATFHLGQEVTQVAKQADGRFFVETSRGTQFLAKTVFIAGGVGSFQPRTLKIDGLEAFRNQQLFYGVHDPAAFANKQLVIAGGSEAALECALSVAVAGAHQVASVTLLHRRDDFRGTPASMAQMRALCEAGRMRVAIGQATGFKSAEGRLTALNVMCSDGVTRELPLDMLLVFLGLSPKLGPIAEWGLGLERKQVMVDTEKFESSTPGIFAVGDINTYPGKKKLILCGFHEATLAAFGAAAHVYPEQRVQLQYTTTSPRLHQLLGVASPAVD